MELLSVLIVYNLIPDETQYAVKEMTTDEYNKWSVLHGVCVNSDKLTKEHSDLADEFCIMFRNVEKIRCHEIKDLSDVHKFLHISVFLD